MKEQQQVIELQRHKFQVEFVRLVKEKRICAFIGGLQGGKTVAGADALAELLWVEDIALPSQSANSYPEVWILSRTYALAETAWNCFLDRWGDMVMAEKERKDYGLYRGDSNVHWLRPGPRKDGKPIRVRVRTTEDPESLRATQNLIIAWGDEAAYWREEAWLNLLGRGIVTPTRFIVTTTPRGKNWLYRSVYLPSMNGRDKTIGSVTCRSIDNPWANKEYLDKLRLKFGPQYAQQELDAQFVENSGLVYNFDRALHQRVPPSMDRDYYELIVFGVDPGYGDPYAVGVWGRTHEGEWWLLEEYYKARVTTDQLIPWFKRKAEKWKPRAMYVDKRRPSDFLLLRKNGFPAYVNSEFYSETSKRTVMPMIRLCQQLLLQNKIFINVTCEWTAEEFETYHFKEVDERNSGENPIDFKNHAMDAMRYAICSVENIPQDHAIRYRSGADLSPKAYGKKKPVKFLTAQEHLMILNKQMDEKEKRQGRKDRRAGRALAVA